MKTRTLEIASSRQKPHKLVLTYAGGMLLLLCATMILLFTSPVQARDFPLCGDKKVEARIINDFNWAERKTWQRGVELVRLTKMHEHRVVNHEGSIVTRRYCMARPIFPVVDTVRSTI